MTTPTQTTKEEDKEFSEIDPLKENGKETQEKTEEKTIPEKICSACRSITVEPSIMLFIISVVVSQMSSINLALEKACRVNLNYSKEICDSLKARETEGLMEYEIAVQKLTARYLPWKTMFTSSIPCILALFIGAWTDCTGHRKLFIIVPIVGQLLSGFTSMLNYYFFYELPLEVLVFSEAIFESLTGSWCFCMMSVFSYISAITTHEDRTFRLGIANFALTVGFPIALGISGVMVKKGYYVAYGTAICLHTVNSIYNVFILKNPERTPSQMMHAEKGVWQLIRMFFDLNNVRQTFGVLVHQGPRKMLLIAIACLLFGSMHGELSIVYLLTRYRYNWDEVMFSIYQTYNFITHTVGTVFSITVFSWRLQWDDSLLGIISTISKICSSLVYFFAYNEFIFFIGPLVEILNGTALLAARAMMTKLVKTEEFGRVNSIFSLGENLMPLIFVPLYTRTYTASMETMPGAVFLLGMLLIIPATLSFGWLFYNHRKQLSTAPEHQKPTEINKQIEVESM